MQTTTRFIIHPTVSQPVTPYEVIDSRHSSDGGPVAIAWCESEEEAQRIAEALTVSLPGTEPTTTQGE